MEKGGLDLVQINSQGSPMTKDSTEPLTGPFLKTCSRVAWAARPPHTVPLLGTVFPSPSRETQAAPFPP